MEYNKPVSNPMLVGAIEVMKAEDTSDHRNLFVGEMMKARFLTPVIVEPEPVTDEKGQVRLTPENMVQFPMLGTPDGKQLFMVFSDRMELDKWSGDKKQTFSLGFDDLAGMVLSKDSRMLGFVINPFGANIVIPRDMIASLLKVKQS